jgi:hypothetical protein
MHLLPLYSVSGIPRNVCDREGVKTNVYPQE